MVCQTNNRVGHCGIIGLSLCLFSSLFLSTPAWSSGINCTKASSLDEKTICAHPDLLQLDRNLSSVFEQIKSKSSGENLSILKETQRFFLKERHDCSNQDSFDPEHEALIRNCVKQALTNRLAVFATFPGDPYFYQELVKQVEFTEPPFFRRYAKLLVGKRIKVFGSLVLLDEKKPSAKRLKGQIVDAPKLKGALPIAVEFTGMHESTAMFLDRNQPISHHEGEVVKQGDQFVLRVDNVLGQELPIE